MKNVLITLLVVYFTCLLLLYFFQRNLLYFPTAFPVQSEHEFITLTSGDLKLNVVTRNLDATSAVIYFGGNAENVWDSTTFHRLIFEGHAVYYLNYPGYGGSTGSPTEDSLLSAANDLYGAVALRHSDISLVGRSLGTGVAVDVASRNKVSKLVLISPYDSITNVAAKHYPIFPVKMLLQDKFDSASKVQGINADVLVLIASNDTVVPPGHSFKLIEEIKASVYFQEDVIEEKKVKHIIFDGYNHNDISSNPSYGNEITKFILE